MATVRVAGVTFKAQPVKVLDDGAWLMTARSHGPRWVPGTPIRVEKNEIIELADTEIPPDATDTSAADLQAAMDAESTKLPSYSQIVAAARAADAMPKPDAPHQDAPMSNALADKLASLANLPKEVADYVGNRADMLMQKKEAVKAKADKVMDKHEAVIAQADAGLEAMDAALSKITNQ